MVYIRKVPEGGIVVSLIIEREAPRYYGAIYQRRRGARGVLRSEKYYPGFGYVSASRTGIYAAFDVPYDHFMAVRLRQDSVPVGGWSGTMRPSASERRKGFKMLA